MKMIILNALTVEGIFYIIMCLD